MIFIRYIFVHFIRYWVVNIVQFGYRENNFHIKQK